MARPRSEVANAKILETAVSLLFEAGLDGFTVDEVASRSGVAKTTIYRHFSSANELLMIALDSTVQPFPTANTGSLRSDLLEFHRAVVPVFASAELRPLMLGILGATSTDPELDKIHQAMISEREAPLRAIIEAAKSRGELPDALPFQEAFDFIEGPLLARWICEPTSIDTMDIERVVDRVIAALRA